MVARIKNYSVKTIPWKLFKSALDLATKNEEGRNGTSFEVFSFGCVHVSFGKMTLIFNHYLYTVKKFIRYNKFQYND